MRSQNFEKSIINKFQNRKIAKMSSNLPSAPRQDTDEDSTNQDDDMKQNEITLITMQTSNTMTNNTQNPPLPQEIQQLFDSGLIANTANNIQEISDQPQQQLQENSEQEENFQEISNNNNDDGANRNDGQAETEREIERDIEREVETTMLRLVKTNSGYYRPCILLRIKDGIATIKFTRCNKIVKVHSEWVIPYHESLVNQKSQTPEAETIYERTVPYHVLVKDEQNILRQCKVLEVVGDFTKVRFLITGQIKWCREQDNEMIQFDAEKVNRHVPEQKDEDAIDSDSFTPSRIVASYRATTASLRNQRLSRNEHFQQNNCLANMLGNYNQPNQSLKQNPTSLLPTQTSIRAIPQSKSTNISTS